MRTWTYSYKTSDGLRHEDEIEAESKDSAYSVLRNRGIHPIRVDEKIAPVVYSGLRGLTRRHYVGLAALVFLSVLVAIAVMMAFRKSSTPAQPQPVRENVPSSSIVSVTNAVPRRNAISSEVFQLPSSEFIALQKASDTLREAHRKAEATIDTSIVSETENLSPDRVAAIRAQLSKGRAIVDLSRANIKKTFYPLYRKISASNQNEQYEAQRLYGQLMEDVDSTEEWLDASEKFLKLVLDEQGKSVVQ